MLFYRNDVAGAKVLSYEHCCAAYAKLLLAPTTLNSPLLPNTPNLSLFPQKIFFHTFSALPKDKHTHLASSSSPPQKCTNYSSSPTVLNSLLLPSIHTYPPPKKRRKKRYTFIYSFQTPRSSNFLLVCSYPAYTPTSHLSCSNKQ